MVRLTRHTGYGNAAGLLAQRGVLGLPHDHSNAPGYSSDELTSEEEEEEEDEVAEEGGGVNPITGTYVLKVTVGRR